MIGTVVTYTVIHVSSPDLEPIPYAVLVVDAAGNRVAARADGDVDWLQIGARVELREDARFGLRAVAAEPVPTGAHAA